MSNAPDEKATFSDLRTFQPIKNKNATSRLIEVHVDEMSNNYAEITSVNHKNNVPCGDETQTGIVYATLEFDANKDIYCNTEPVKSSQRKHVASDPTMVGAEGTIYANV